MKYKLIILTLSLLLFACLKPVRYVFKLPKNVVLHKNHLFHPLSAENLLEDPNRNGSIWNDSLIQLCGIQKIILTNKGGKNPDEVRERIVYSFLKNGKTQKYSHYKTEGKTLIYGQSGFFYKENKIRINAKTRQGKQSKDFMSEERTGSKTIKVFHNLSLKKTDSVICINVDNKTKVLIDKIGSFTAKIEVFVPDKTPTSYLPELFTDLGISKDQYESAELIVTYYKENLPYQSFQIGPDFVQLDKMKEWNYNHKGFLSSFHQWVRGTLLSEYYFIYNNYGLLSKIKYNKQVWEVDFEN